MSNFVMTIKHIMEGRVYNEPVAPSKVISFLSIDELNIDSGTYIYLQDGRILESTQPIYDLILDYDRKIVNCSSVIVADIVSRTVIKEPVKRKPRLKK